MTAKAVQLIGLDFGTTTSSAVIASTRLMRGAVGRVEFASFEECFRSELVFTPLREGDLIDEEEVSRLLDDWLAAGRRSDARLFGGGALLTGLTARKANAATLVKLIRQRLGNALIASADDPCLESWLAFMGSAAALSRSLPDRPIVNLDIGGGTTNIALGLNGEVRATGCLYVGARHVQVRPGTYRIERLSSHGQAMIDYLGIDCRVGDVLDPNEIIYLMAGYVNILRATAEARFSPLLPPQLEQIPYRPPPTAKPIVTLSGGVGALVYAHLDGKPWPSTTQYGDLGIDLARAIVDCGDWNDDLRRHRPQSGGRATVYGLLRHSTEISGSTLFLPDASLLPLTDLPIVGSIDRESTDAHVLQLLELARRSAGACLHVSVGSHEAEAVAGLGKRLAGLLRLASFPPTQPLILLLRENLGKTLGHYVTEWGRLPVRLVVIDEVPVREAQFAQIGAEHGPVVPVSYYGFAPPGEKP